MVTFITSVILTLLQEKLAGLGCYRLEERQAPAGMVLNTQPEYVELTYAGETVEVTQTAVGLYDERQKVDVSLFKALETDELFGLGMNEEYKDISFGLYASDNLTAADGSVIPAGGLLEVVSVSANEAGGYDASFASDLPFGSYYVKERTTNSAYILSDTEYPVVFEYADQEAALVQILVNEGEAVSNDLLRGRVDGVKVGENPEGGYLCEIFTAFVAKPSESGSDTSPWRLSWKDDGAYTTWLTAMAERSVVETDVTVTSSDKVLTLSTCTPGGASRFIVMAKLAEVNN